jgi:hypothetical protein
MFNLEQAIEQWRRQLATGGLNSPELLDELEGHLRDDIEAQVLSGVDKERAFELAVTHLGRPGELIQGFAKHRELYVAPSRILLRYFYFLCAAVAVLSDLWTLISFELSPAARVGAACGVAVFGFYLFGLPLLSWWRRAGPSLFLLRIVKILALVVPLWILFALLTALRVIHKEIGIIPEMIMWSLCAAYGLTALDMVLNQGPRGQCGPGGGFSPSNPTPTPIPPPRPCPPEVDIPVPPTTAFTPTALRALENAREEALNLGHDYIGTEHVLLGVLKSTGGALARALHSSSVNSETIRAEVGRLISFLPARPANTALPLTPRARKALKIAGREARALQHSSIEAEHILLGLLREGTGIAAVALTNLGIRLEWLRTEISQG